MIFRWTIWGAHKEKGTELLRYSILSFRKQFGGSHKYLVYTDTPDQLADKLGDISEILNFTKVGCAYDIDSKATWKKWCPGARIDINEIEVYVDSDVFLLKYPLEFDEFINDPRMKFGIMDEFNGQPWQHGAMQKKADKYTLFVNAGFFVQKIGADISSDLLNEFIWWKKNIPEDKQTHHDEQGALAIALTKYFKNNELYVFPKDKYALIGPNENKNINNLENITMFHAVYPDHPAFYRFKDYLDSLLK